MELAGQANYRQLAEEIGEVLQAAAETAEKMVEDARAEAARIRAEAEGDRRTAYAEGRRILDEARMEADMVRAEADWQAQEIIAEARRQAAERMAGADSRLAELNQAENQVRDRLAAAGQVLAEALAMVRDGTAPSTGPAPMAASSLAPDTPADPPAAVAETESDGPSAKVYFVEFPPAAPADPTPTPAPAETYLEPDAEIVLTESPRSSLSDSEEEHSEWAPPPDMPVWWTRDGAQG